MWIWQCQTLAAWYKCLHRAHMRILYIKWLHFILFVCLHFSGRYCTYFVRHVRQALCRSGKWGNKSFGRLETTYMFKPTHLFIFISDGISMKSLFFLQTKILGEMLFFCMSLYSYDYSVWSHRTFRYFSPILYVFVTYKYLVKLWMSFMPNKHVIMTINLFSH